MSYCYQKYLIEQFCGSALEHVEAGSVGEIGQCQRVSDEMLAQKVP